MADKSDRGEREILIIADTIEIPPLIAMIGYRSVKV